MGEFWHQNVLMFKAENIKGFIVKSFHCSQFVWEEFYVTGKSDTLYVTNTWIPKEFCNCFRAEFTIPMGLLAA